MLELYQMSFLMIANRYLYCNIKHLRFYYQFSIKNYRFYDIPKLWRVKVPHGSMYDENISTTVMKDENTKHVTNFMDGNTLCT